MATLAHSSSDAPQRQLNGTEPKVHHLDTVAGLLPRLEPAHVRQPAKRRLEGKIRSFGRQAIDLPQYHPGRGDSCELRLERRQTARNQIGVYEVNHSRVFG